MTRLLGLVLAALAIALAACGGSGSKPPPPKPKKTPPASGAVTRAEKPLRGLAIGITEANPNFIFPPGGSHQAPPEFARWAREVDAMRPGFYRLLLDWPSLEPEPGKTNFDAPNQGCLRGTPPCGPYNGLRDQLAALAAQQKRGGWQALVVIVGTPDWAARRASGCERDGTTARSRPPRSDQLGAYEAFVGKVLALARDEGADLRYWSPWNEPNHPYALSPQRTRCSASAPTVAPKRYAEIAQSLQRALDAAPGDQEMVLGELAGLPKSRPYTTGISEFIEALPKQLVCSVTVWTQHGYVGGVNPVDDVERGLAEHGCRVPQAIWMTETGVGAAGLGRKRSATEKKQRGTCEALHRRLLQWYRDKRVTAAFQYTVREDDVFPVGLVTTDLKDAYPSLDEWKAWGQAKRPRPEDPPPPESCGAPASPEAH
jgi:predicted small lipoprotein YifL